MSIDSPELVGQLAEAIANRLLKQAGGGLSSLPASRRQNWRFQPPQRTPETEAMLRAYWDDVLSARRQQRAAEEEAAQSHIMEFFHSSELTDDNYPASA